MSVSYLHWTYCQLWALFSISIFDFEHVLVCRVFWFFWVKAQVLLIFLKKQSHSLPGLHSVESTNDAVSRQYCFQREITCCDLSRIIFSAKMLWRHNGSEQVVCAELRASTIFPIFFYLFINLHDSTVIALYFLVISWKNVL